MIDGVTNADVDLARDIQDALRAVIDPELGVNVVDLGLVYEVSVRDGCVAEIRMTTTTRGCPATGFLRQAVEDRAWDVQGVEFVTVGLTYEPQWTPELMTPGLLEKRAPAPMQSKDQGEGEQRPRGQVGGLQPT
jgi:metal-sulfur cluster biosynthetic enzyme